MRFSVRTIERKGFARLLRGPFRGGMRRDVKVHNTSSIVCEDDKDKQDFKQTVWTVKKSTEASCDT